MGKASASASGCLSSAVASICTSAARRLADLGLGHAYYNHDFEFDRVSGETTGDDVLTSETRPGLVKLELDFQFFYLNVEKIGIEHFFVDYDRPMNVDASRQRSPAETLKGMALA